MPIKMDDYYDDEEGWDPPHGSPCDWCTHRWGCQTTIDNCDYYEGLVLAIKEQNRKAVEEEASWDTEGPLCELANRINCGHPSCYRLQMNRVYKFAMTGTIHPEPPPGSPQELFRMGLIP